MEKSDTHQAECVTCWMAEERPCDYVDVVFSASGQLYVLNCAGPHVPESHLVTVYNQTGTVYWSITSKGHPRPVSFCTKLTLLYVYAVKFRVGSC